MQRLQSRNGTGLRQKEIDDANRWWAERWKVFYESGDQPTYNGIIDELNAAAARVMEVKG